MVIGAFPAAKLGLLAVRQVAKPMANVIKDRAKKSPVFRKYICMPPAQFYNWMEVKMKMWALNLGKPVTVPPLNEGQAIDLGANLLGEFIVFFVGAGALLVEYARQTKNENKKQEALRLERIELTNTISELKFRLERQDAQLREMTRALADVESRSIFHIWPKERINEYTPFDPNNPDQTSPQNRRHRKISDYSATGNVLFRAINFLETQIFLDAHCLPPETNTEQQQAEEFMPENELQPYVVTIPQQQALQQ